MSNLSTEGQAGSVSTHTGNGGGTHVSFYHDRAVVFKNFVNNLEKNGHNRLVGFFSWIFSTDHKRIGLLYLIGVMGFFLVAMSLGFLMRLELIAPGETIMKPETYNSVFTLHGVIMIFLFIIPGIPATFGNFFLPIQLGAKDVAFPRLNLFSWYLYVTGAVIALTSLFVGDAPADTGWTFYAPYSIRSAGNVSMATSAAFVLGFSSILTGLNFVTTIHRLRCPGMTWFRMPLFAWSLYATGWIQVLATPVIGITLLLVILERAFHIGLFDPSLGGDPILYQHLFWIYSHPAVYIMALPAFGVISEIIPQFTRRTIFGYNFIAMSSVAIAAIGYLVWGHHMFTSGMSDMARWVFSFLTFFVAVPTGVKIFNWTASLYKGSIYLKTPMLWTLGSIFVFSIGGLTGLLLASLATDIHVHDTYFVVGHFHYVMFGSAGFMVFAALHYWSPKMFNRMYNETVARISFAIFFVGFNVLYFSMFVLGMMGMPRRYYDYLPDFTTGNLISTIGSWIMILGILLTLGNLIKGWLTGKPAGMNPWKASTLEWTVPSPPPVENFEDIPVVDHGPYYFGELDKVKQEAAR